MYSYHYELNTILEYHAHNLHLPDLIPVWKSVKAALCSFGIHSSGTEDHLLWSVPNAKLLAGVKDIYTDMINSKVSNSCSIYPLSFWKSGCLVKTILF